MGAVQWAQRLAERQALGRQSTLRGAYFADSFGMHQVVAETPAHRNLRETRRANHHHHQDVPTAMTTRTHPQDAAASPSSCAWPKSGTARASGVEHRVCHVTANVASRPWHGPP